MDIKTMAWNILNVFRWDYGVVMALPSLVAQQAGVLTTYGAPGGDMVVTVSTFA